MNDATQTFEFTNVTLYTRGDSHWINLGNITKTECRSLKVDVRPYAQYQNAVVVTFVKKGARRECQIVQTSNPDVVVLAGHGQMEPDGAFKTDGPAHRGVTIERAKHRSGDTRWQGDFSAKLAAYVAETGAKIVADYREHKIEEK